MHKNPNDLERKSTLSTMSNFENMIRDTNLFDTNILDYIEKELFTND